MTFFARHPRLLAWLFRITLTVLQISFLLVVFNLWSSAREDGQGKALREAGIVMLAESRHLPQLVLDGTDGRSWHTADLSGKWSLVFFGYTYCPDICPTTLAELREIYHGLPHELQADTRVLMVSVDPQRDTPEQLRAYLDFFDPDFQGLTGALTDIQTLSQALGIPFIPGDTSQPGYTVDHSGNLALVGPDGRQHGFVRAPFNVSGLIEQLPIALTSR